MKVCIDKDKCIGCGLCAGLEPSVFEMSEDGFARVLREAAEEESVCENIRQAKEICPVSAIEEKE